MFPTSLKYSDGEFSESFLRGDLNARGKERLSGCHELSETTNTNL